tara:strand:+ start:28 stop:186 length:159 start_codon:yes stop_codon:yes gene_type:complete
MELRTNGHFIAFPVNDEWKVFVKSLGDYQALSRTGISREQMLINYNDKTTKN